MERALSVSFFPTQSPAGIALYDSLTTLAAQRSFDLKVSPHPTLARVAAACWNDDAVIFDGSIEDNVHNYEIAFEPLKGMRHGLIVSRTPLPLNFAGIREGGAPPYPALWDNQRILDWLARELSQLQRRPWQEKGFLFQIVAQSRSFDWARQQRKGQGQIFMSYRSRYSQQITQLQERIRTGIFHQGTGKTMFFFPPGSLAFEDEVLTAMRRWQVLSIIRDYILDCEEFWIYLTDDYLDSWWTRGELATLIYHKMAKKRIRIYDARHSTLRDGSYDELSLQTEEEHKRMARWFANTDPLTMGAESSIILGEAAASPVLGNMPFIKDPVWKDDFQHFLIMQCSSQQCRASRRATQSVDHQFSFDMSAFLWMRENDLFPINHQQLQEAVESSSTIACPRCNTRYRFRREPRDRYLYLALPVGKGAEGQNLQALPVYRPV